MKPIVKIAALAMVMAIALALTACGGSASSSAASSGSASSAAASSSAASSEAASSEATSSEAASSEAASSEAASSEAASSASASAESASSASAESDKYTNEYFGIAYMLPDGWSFADPANVEEINSQAAATAAGAAIGMAAKSADGQSSVIVTIEEANDANSGQTAEAHLDAEVKQLTESASGNASFTTEKTTVTFPDTTTELPAAATELTVAGNSLQICQAVMEKDGDFLDIVILGPTQDSLSEALSGFHLILS